MVKDKILKSGNKFGPRYGRRNRDRFAKLEYEQRKLHKCPSCHANQVKRVSLGIWACRKCNMTFASKAYTVDQGIVKKGIQEMNSGDL